MRKDFGAALGRAAEEYVEAGANIHSLELTEEQISAANLSEDDLICDSLEHIKLDTIQELIDSC